MAGDIKFKTRRIMKNPDILKSIMEHHKSKKSIFVVEQQRLMKHHDVTLDELKQFCIDHIPDHTYNWEAKMPKRSAWVDENGLEEINARLNAKVEFDLILEDLPENQETPDIKLFINRDGNLQVEQLLSAYGDKDIQIVRNYHRYN